jgi:hypothetical protein
MCLHQNPSQHGEFELQRAHLSWENLAGFFDKGTGQESFRFQIGVKDKTEEVKLWNYGIAMEGDFNGDGVEDFSWYGGDDTGFHMYLLLSSGPRFRKIDVLATLAHEWLLRYRARPDLGRVGDYDSEVRIEAGHGSLVLVGAIVELSTVSPRHIEFRTANLVEVP